MPTWPAITTGANETRRPWAADTARIVSFTSTTRSAAATGAAAAVDSSSCPAAYSGWNWSTGTPCSSSAASRART